MPASSQLSWQKRVFGDEARQERETGERRVRAGVEDQCGRELHQDEAHVPGRPRPECRLGHLTDHGWRAVRIRHGVRLHGQI
jgi:hypothetical protein